MTARIFVGRMPDATPVLVTVWDEEGVAELAFKEDARWGLPIELSEETA